MSRFLSIIMLAALVLLPASPAAAVFHLMQIEQVIGGVDGDTGAQAIQLRMRSAFQNLLAGSRLVVHDAAGANPIVVMDFAATVPNHGVGVRVLAASSGFASQTSPAADPDFILDNLIPSSYLAAGSLTFEDDAGLTVSWRLSWGGGDYTGPTTGGLANDPDGDFGPPYPGVLPSGDHRAVLFQGEASAQSTTNADDYELTLGGAVFTNNNDESFVVTGGPTAVEDAGAPGHVVPSRIRSLPNPFAASTRVEFELGAEAFVTLAISDVTGRRVAVLEGARGAGRQSFDWGGRDQSGATVPAGVYFYRLGAGSESLTGRVLKVR